MFMAVAEFTGVVLVLCVIIAAQIRILAVCGRNPGLQRKYLWVAGSHWGWMLFVVLRLTTLAGTFDPGDAVLHERKAREIARGFHTKKLWQAQDYLGAGNRAYQLTVGSLYAVTGAPEFTVYFVNANLGFLGMLSLLELIARCYDLDRVPIWLLPMTVLLPSALFWTTTHLKEGACVWGICTLLHALFYYPDGTSRTWQLVWCLIGLGVLGLFRPHIALAWVTALACGAIIQRRGLYTGILCGLAALAVWQTVVWFRPDITKSFSEEGVVATLENRLAANASRGGSAVGSTSTPIPIISGLAMICLRPYPMEVFDARSALAGVEVWALTGTACLGWLFLLRRGRITVLPVIVTSIVALVLLAFFFGYMFNLGLMVRQRLQAMPALIMLAAFPHLVWRIPTPGTRVHPATGPSDDDHA